MDPRHVRSVTAFLARKGFQALIVGGVVMERQGLAGTTDVDVLVAVSEFAEASTRLAGDPKVEDFGVEESTAKGFLRLGNKRIRFDLLDPSYFSGTRSGDEFFRYAWNHWATDEDIGRTALPPLVWYTRLLVESEAYLERIADDLDDGAPAEWLDQALQIARQFKNETRIRERLRKLNEIRPIGRSGAGNTRARE